MFIVHALSMAFAMFWEILWALILGFALSGAVQAVVSKKEMTRLLPDDSLRTLAIACGLGAASSSCSYAAVALARSLFRKGANFTAAMVFQLASTNLVAELGIIMIVLLGWQFALAEFLGAPLMVAILVTLFRWRLRRDLVDRAKRQADKGIAGSMEGHAEMDMAVSGGSIWSRIRSSKGFTAISHYFIMDWASVWRDVAAGLLIAGALGAWVSSEFWKSFFFVRHPTFALLWGPLVGPLVAVISFVCSVGNVPLAAVLWNSGISFGGVIAFIFADLIVIPIIDIYRRYYTGPVAWLLTWTMFVAVSVAGLAVELLFKAVGWVPSKRHATVTEAHIAWNYTTILNVIFLALAAILVWRAATTGGFKMLRMMNMAPQSPDASHRMRPKHAH
jgi:uncharacterized protein